MPNKSHISNHTLIYGINIKKSIQNFFNFHNKAMVHSIEFMVSYTQILKNFSIRKMDEKYVLNRLGFKSFKHTFIWKF